MVTPMRVDWPGLLEEKTPSGARRYRVRTAGDKKKRITLSVDPSHPAFSEHYHAARQGVQLPKPTDEIDEVQAGSIGWLVLKFQKHMEQQVQSGNLDVSTQNYRTRHTNILRSAYGEKNVQMPPAKFIDLRDTMLDCTATADTFKKSIRAMYKWAIERGHAKTDPTAGIGNVHISRGGAKPWTLADIEQYKAAHPPGTMAHLYLTLLMFTACRIGDAVTMGRHNEFQRDGETWLKWSTEKLNAPDVAVPIAPQLLSAIRSQTVVGPTYILSTKGKPFASKKALGNRFDKWIEQAGLSGLSSHGVRKAAGDILADAGMSQHTIMAIHGHTEARTSEMYTKGADRLNLARQGMDALAKLNW